MAKSGRVLSITRRDDEGSNSAVIKAANDYASRQITDPFAESYTFGSDGPAALPRTLRPPYDPQVLKLVPTQNNILLQCIAAMVTNCDLFGHDFDFIGEAEERESVEAQDELKRIKSLLENPNGKTSFKEIRRKLRNDFETFGYFYIEVGRNAIGEIAWFDHAPGETMRLCEIDETPVEVERQFMRGGEVEKITVREHFRPYVQQVGGKRIYFKEFGDPRDIHPETGREVSESLSEGEDYDPATTATEIIHFCNYTSGEPYGTPRWINNVIVAIGSRESDLVNLQFFKDNAIPAMAVLVSGGQLTEESIDALKDQFGATGLDAQNRVLVLEAKGDDLGGSTDDSPPVPTLKIQPLAHERQNDATFSEYDKDNRRKVRSSFRLPPIFVGESDDYTRATADASVDMANNQVFAPEREAFDDMVNHLLLSKEGQPPKYWRMKSKGAMIVSTEEILDALEILAELGAATPNLAIGVANQNFGLSIPDIEEDWGNQPFGLVKELIIADAIPKGDGFEKAFKSLQKVVSYVGKPKRKNRNA